MKKYLIILLLFCILLPSCNRDWFFSGYVDSLMSRHEYRKVIKVLNKDTTGLCVPMDASDIHRHELSGYNKGILADYYYYKAYAGLKKYRKAARHIVRYLEKTGHDRPYFESGIALIEMCYVMAWNCPKYSIGLLEESLAKDSTNYQLKLVLASLYENTSVYRNEGKYDKAIRLYDEIESSLDSTQRTSLNYWKSDCYVNMDKDSKAIEEMTRALEKSGYTDLTDLYHRATIYQNHLKDYESAIKDYTRMIEVSDEEYGAYCGRSRCYEELGDTLSAKRDEATAEYIQDSLYRDKLVRDSVSMSVSLRQRFHI